jgi:hypothetical protein
MKKRCNEIAGVLRAVTLREQAKRQGLTFSLAETASDFGKQWIFAGLTAHTQIGTIRIRKA